MPQTPNSYFAQFADNNVKVDQAIDGLVGSALKNDSGNRTDLGELKKTAKLLIISDLTSGGKDSTDGED